MDNLKKDIKELEIFKNQIDSKQLNFPLDANSISTSRLDIVVANGNFVVPSGLVSYNESIEIDVDGKRFFLATSQVIP